MQTFTKEERLTKKIIIERLFAEGNNFIIHPLRIKWLILPEGSPGHSPVQLLISVPKRNIRKAVVRNLVKRRIRETYRKNKSILYDGIEKSGFALAFIYMATKPILHDEMHEKIILVLRRLHEEYEKTNR